ncbi:uncharacterized protein LOC114248560 [Bombyx mandarina]|uniref:Uncharacterized protein LOC114248560 n=1 Tax=Bombyx mandarina TaxID=7092 RepID=A0A6J2K7R8_BOMMA|nr:uncharacterized protein LOC114248560 [Bombyx mandarina]
MDDYQIQNICRYSRKTYKKIRRDDYNVDSQRPNNDLNTDTADVSPRSDGGNEIIVTAESPPGCTCDLESEGEIANILHKKCPVITLAQQQLQRLLDETDKLLCDNTRCCRSIYDFLHLCSELISTKNKCRCILVFMLAMVFFVGLVLGAASCGSYHGHFNSPIISCIDNFFISDTHSNIEDTYRIVV